MIELALVAHVFNFSSKNNKISFTLMCTKCQNAFSQVSNKPCINLVQFFFFVNTDRRVMSTMLEKTVGLKKTSKLPAIILENNLHKMEGLFFKKTN